jgi:hypothetical protein
MINSVEPLVNWNLSSVRTSRVPSDLERTYLSSSNGKNTWSVPEVKVFVELLVIVISNSLLIIRMSLINLPIQYLPLEEVQTISHYFELFEYEYKELKDHLHQLLCQEIPPSQTPVTVVTPLNYQ